MSLPPPFQSVIVPKRGAAYSLKIVQARMIKSRAWEKARISMSQSAYADIAETTANIDYILTIILSRDVRVNTIPLWQMMVKSSLIHQEPEVKNLNNSATWLADGHIISRNMIFSWCMICTIVVYHAVDYCWIITLTLYLNYITTMIRIHGCFLYLLLCVGRNCILEMPKPKNICCFKKGYSR